MFAPPPQASSPVSLGIQVEAEVGNGWEISFTYEIKFILVNNKRGMRI